MSAVSLTQPALQTPASAASDTGGLDLDSGDSSLLRAESRLLAPGLEATSFDRLQPEGWVTGDVLVADLSVPTLSLDVSDSGELSRPAPVTEHRLGEQAVAAVNGSFFDINNSGAAFGTNISSSEGLKSASSAPAESLTIARGLAAVQALSSAATVDVNGGSQPVSSVNSHEIPADGIGYFTSAWGEHPISRAIGGPTEIDPTFLRVEIADGVLVRTSTDLEEITAPTSIPEGTGVLLARGAAVAQFADLQPGDPLPVTVSASADVDMAISGMQRLVTDGEPTTETSAEEPRTAAGVSADGTTIYVVSIDGRQTHSRGMMMDELAEFMVDLGAHNAVNLDGGGSSTLLVREPGTNALSVANAPSDGQLRDVPNSLVFSSSAPTDGPVDVMVKPGIDAKGADAVFPGLSRTVKGIGLDANQAATSTAGTFSLGGDRATIEQLDGNTAVVTGESHGAVPVSYTADGKTATMQLQVLGTLEQLTADSSVIALADGESTATVQITGHDRDGFTAPVEASDLTVTSGADVAVEATGPDVFTITPQTSSGAATVSFAAEGRRVDVAVTVGLDEVPITDLADAQEWEFLSDRATGGIAVSEGPEGEAALTLDYDFASSTGTRGAYAVAPEPITIPGQPQAINMWIHGDGNGSWPRLQMKTGLGTTINLDGPFVTWTGWQQVTFPVPTGTAYPLTLERIRMMETAPAMQYSGTTSFAQLTAVIAPDVEQPVAPVVHDPMIVTNGTVDSRSQRIAVMSDAQFVARDPEGANAQGARQTLSEIRDAEPDLLVINGDFVDEAAPEDFTLAREILDEEIGDELPWIYVPGNHEVMGGPIQNFIDEFGETRTTQRMGSTLVVTLNTASGSFNSSDETQLRAFEESLAEAESDSRVSGVLVFAHHPADDPKSSKDSQLSDRIEAERFLERLGEFREDSGKSIALMNAHAGVFHATSADGVPNLVTGNSGKSPSGSPDQGGFTGWAMLGLNPGSGVVGAAPVPVTSRTNWLQTEVRPRVDSITLGASTPLPSGMTVGETLTVDATISQDEGRIVPVQWPLSAQWGGDGIVIDDGTDAETHADVPEGMLAAEAIEAGVLRFNPSTGQLTATGEGQATLQLTVNGETVEQTITVGEVTEEPGDGEGTDEPGDGESGSESPGDGGSEGSGGNATDDGSTSTSDTLAVTGGDARLTWLVGVVGLGLLLTAALLVRRTTRDPQSDIE